MARMHYLHSAPAAMPAFRRKKGFTLLELAIVLTIIALIMGGGLSLYSERLLAEKVKLTHDRLDKVESSLAQYVRNFGTLPCPAVGNIGVDEAATTSQKEFGRQSCNESAHSLKVAVAGNRTGGGSRYVLLGAVPTKALGLPNQFAFDGWNNRLMYVVDNEYSYASADNVSFTTAQWGPKNGALTVRGYMDSDEKTNCGGDCPGYSGGIYVLYSLGENGWGAWRDKALKATVRNNSPMIGARVGVDKENINSHVVTSGGAYKAATLVYRDSPMKLTDNTATYFDDIVRWKTRLQF